MVDGLLKRQKDASIYKISIDSWNSEYVKNLLSSQGLFLPKYVIVFNFISENKEFFSELLEFLPELKNTEHICIVAEKAVTKKDEEKIKFFSQKSQNFNDRAGAGGNGKGEKKEPPTFALADAFATRDFLKSMKYFTELRRLEIAAEEIHGVLWWQMKAVKLSAEAQSAVGAGLSPFVFKKSKSAAAIWDKPHLELVIHELFEMYHRAHRGELDFYTTLERLIVRWGK